MKPQRKYRLGTASNNYRGGGGGQTGFTAPQPSLSSTAEVSVSNEFRDVFLGACPTVYPTVTCKYVLYVKAHNVGLDRVLEQPYFPLLSIMHYAPFSKN